MLCPYTQDELVDIGVRYRQRTSESLPTWLLCLWDMGMENIVVLGTEMSRMASLTTHPSLRQWLQNAHHASGNQTRLEWLTAAIRIVWPNLMQSSNGLSNSLTKDSMNIKAHIRMLLEGLRELQGMQNFPENPHY
ncbi:protein UXT isoform X1 [Manis pentadactyla]|uniref:protein UXT isoform X1 n=1 Tax=Manis pentadactyla TaxID=143292 RepID=UPI00255C386A|nr:protein UXT isoform X1 [Manis pentadactyla]